MTGDGYAISDFLTPRDRQVFSDSGYGKTAGFGKRPVVLVIDVTYNFCGDTPEPILESITRWRNSCGAEAWEAISQIRALIDCCHSCQIPVIYTTGTDYRADGFDAGRWADKNHRFGEAAVSSGGIGNQIVEPLAPAARDIVISKAKPSAFFGTLLGAHLVSLRADSVIVCGTTTSGCVRSTVVDAFSHNYRVSVVEDCTFDRGQATHHINLFDMQHKYADVVSSSQVADYLERLPQDLFVEEFPILAVSEEAWESQS
jgi:nicotinamidase-related amidase